MRIVIGEDQALLREGIARLLEEAGFDVVGQAGDAVDLRRKVGAHKPDVAVVDIQMPPTRTDDGLRAAIDIRAEHPSTRVLVLSHHLDSRYAMRLLEEVRAVMLRALGEGGTSFDSLYVNVNGQSGYFDRSLNVYGREGEACKRCGAVIRRDKFMNRSSFYCPRCQPRPRG